MTFPITSDVKLKKDKDGVVRRIHHPRQAYTPEDSTALTAAVGAGESPTPRQLADEYLRDVLHIFGLNETMADDLVGAVATEVQDEGPKLRFLEEKEVGNQAVVSYVQTDHGLPVWQSGVAVKIAARANQVISSQSTVQLGIAIVPPDTNAPYLPEKLDAVTLAGLLGLADEDQPTINDILLFIFRFDPDDRGNASGEPCEDDERQMHVTGPTLQLPSLPDDLVDGRYYVVSRVLFTLESSGWGEVNWAAFVEPETGAVLRLDSFVGCVDGLVYLRDPLTKTSNPAIRPSSPAATLDALRDRVTLDGLTPPGQPPADQALRGEFVQLQDLIPPATNPPTEPQNNDFEYSVPTDDFAAVNAYYHCDRLFRMMEEMGFDVQSYFNGTTFPVRVDHRVSYRVNGIPTANVVNASAPGNAFGNGSDGFRFALVQRNTDVGMAVEWWVILHEFGHTILWDHLSSPNFRFAHSPGDSLAAILNDPESQAPDRSVTFPWTPISRRHDRRVQDGWGWGGRFDDTWPVGHPFSHDRAGYDREQILSSTLFRFYRSIGGDHTDVAVQGQTARLSAFLIFTAVGSLSAVAPPQDAEDFAEELMDADLGLDEFEGHPGGALQKVIRWAFERQGSYQSPGAPTPVVQPGAPPAVDVYLNDGRGGGYDSRDHFVFSTNDIWNRTSDDRGQIHQQPVAGQPNFLYVKVKNRGTENAENVLVSAFVSSEHGERLWPSAWTAMNAVPVSAAAPIPPQGELIIGPVEWTPANEDPVTILASISADDDPSNADSVGGNIPVARLAHCDNNIAGRAMTVSAAEPVPPDPSEVIVETRPRRSIPDADPLGVVSTLDISDSGTIARIDVSVTILHTFIGDLKISLTSPAGVIVTIFQGDWEPTENLIATYSSVNHAALAALHGDNATGVWRLRVVDRIGIDVGTLERWGLKIRLAP